MTVSASGIEPSQRHLNNIQTTGREYRNVTEPAFEIDRTNDVGIHTRDGTTLLADVYRPVAAAKFPALVSFSPYPRQIQDLGAPVGFIEAGATDFFVPRGYVQVIANARGTGGSEGTYSLFDHQEWQDIADVIEWAAAQPLMISRRARQRFSGSPILRSRSPASTQCSPARGCCCRCWIVRPTD